MPKQKKSETKNKLPVSKKKLHEQMPDGKKEQKKIEASKQKKEKVNVFEENPRTKKPVHLVMPYLLMILAGFVLVCFVLIDLFDGVSSENGVGVVGKGIRDILCGIFGFGAFFVPVFLAILSATWLKAVEKNCLLAKIFYSICAVVSVSTLIHVIYVTVTEPFGINAGAKLFYQRGILLEGGGAVGGFLGEVCRTGLGLVGSVILTVALALLFVIFLFGLTPGYVGTLIKYKAKMAKERRAAEAEEKRAERELAKEEERRAKLAELKAKKEEEERKKAEEESIKKAEEEKARAQEEAAEKRRLEALAKAEEEERARAEEERLKAEEDARKIEELMKQKEKEQLDAKKASQAEKPGEDMKDMLDEVFGGKKPSKKAPALQKKQTEGSDSQEENPDADLLSAMKELEAEDIEYEEDDIDEIQVEKEDVAEYQFPPITLLAEDTVGKVENTQELKDNAEKLMATLRSFNVRIKDIGYSRGPTITRYELVPEAGQRVRSIANLVDDISLSLATTGVRIEAPIPNKPAVGIEVPNSNPTTVYLRSLIETERFTTESSKLTACLGADVGGKSVYFNIAKMPHLLIAGATGMGKSVCINSIIVSLLYKARPDEVKLILIDPKKVEFNIYKDIPHLYCPIVSDPAKAAGALASAVAEMERRFALIEDVGVRDIYNYNALTKDDPEREFMPHMVIIIDELADLMMTAADAVESSICRLAQKARAAGIHIIIGTQRPSVDVITGLIKANIPSRIACTVASQVDSRTIIDIAGAEKLIGKGDMLFAPVGAAKPMRVQGAFVSESEVEKIVSFIKANNSGAKYDEEFIKRIDEESVKCTAGKKGASAPMSEGNIEGGLDPKFKEAAELAIDSGKISTSLLQRRLEIGYGRAAKIIDQMEEMGYVSAPDGNKPRKILISKEDFMQQAINGDI